MTKRTKHNNREQPIDVATSLPKDIRLLEEETMIHHARRMLQKKYNVTNSWYNVLWLQNMGNCALLQKVLSSDVVSKEDCHVLYEHYGDFDIQVVRDILRGKTDHRNDDERGHAQALWLQRAAKPCSSKSQYDI